MAEYLDRPFHGSLRCLIGGLDWFLQGLFLFHVKAFIYFVYAIRSIIPRYFHLCCILHLQQLVFHV